MKVKINFFNENWKKLINIILLMFLENQSLDSNIEPITSNYTYLKIVKIFLFFLFFISLKNIEFENLVIMPT